MCGFVGSTGAAWDIRAGAESIAHRGPDQSRVLLDGPVRVGFRRLAIIDLAEEANQPMFAPDGETWIVFNGEIYGYRSLRRQLEAKGVRFRTHSDTEVLLHAYLEWGDAFIDRVDGMFAIVFWDARRQLLKLFRDRPGIKPLYYFFDGKTFAFASELKALEKAAPPNGLGDIDGTALYDFLSYRYVPAPKALYQRCAKLPPAHHITFDPATRRIHGPTPYWRLPVPREAEQVSVETATAALRDCITSAVDDQMIADVPVGFFLSGGVDSSVVVAAAAETGRALTTFAIGFDAHEVSETQFARQVAETFGTAHHERILGRNDAESLLPRLKEWFDEPFADPSSMPTFLVARTARDEVKVVLTGDGGDEVFGGYSTYRRFARYDAYPSWPAAMEAACDRWRRRRPRRDPIRRLLSIADMAFSSGPALWGKIMGGMSSPAKAAYRELLEIPGDYDDWWHYRQHWRDDLPLRTRLQYVDFHTFLPGLVLNKVDRTTMAVSLEARVPLLDRRVVEFSFAVPEDLRYYGGGAKGLLREAYRNILPDSILDRRKKGFGVPRYYLRDLDDGRPIQEHVLTGLFQEALDSRLSS